MMILLIVATVAAIGFFFVLDQVSEYPVERYMEESDYVETRIRKAVAGFQEYITENRIHSRDAEKIYKWIQEQKLLSLSIYKDGIQVFDRHTRISRSGTRKSRPQIMIGSSTIRLSLKTGLRRS